MKVIIVPGKEDPVVNLSRAIADLIHSRIMALPENQHKLAYDELLSYMEENELNQ